MSIQLYNTLTRKKEAFKPIEEGKVRFYVCGPTVYNYIHIGNARSTVAFDTIRRYLEFRGYEVNYVSNFTDVDDKIIKAAKEENLTPVEVADKYIEAFTQDTRAINVKPATIHPRVMDNIPEIVSFVQSLVDQDFAYESEGDVYFRTNKFETYGQLSDQSIQDLLVGASERVDETLAQRKEDPLDFALWKATKADDEINWPSPWGAGRPGWHIECSVMATKYLGNTLDIHGGGQDLQFPHHENEIAQSESHTHEVFANYWLHNGFVTMGSDEEKMSKSLGNFVLLRDILKEVEPMVVRFLLGTVHYRRPLKYDCNALQDAQANVDKIREVLRKLSYRAQDAVTIENELTETQEWFDKIAGHKAAFIKAMDDDFNAANGITTVLDLVKTSNQYLEKATVNQTVLDALTELLTQLLDIFGLDLSENQLLDQDIQDLIDERKKARLAKDFARSDEIRDQLKGQGIILDDTPQGTQWKRVK
ncbi:cysteine--tRNA ligase [Fundicoccus sp. Sow4_D5]|uniref:cysteine--tRNA ligase n=1 Tax=Fundicoccus sp. Sow4_D5 TaxID=3438782 RepID=UPI003F8DBF4C